MVVNMGGIGFWRIRTQASRPERHLLYLHGGAYIDAQRTHVWAPECRLAPEHPCRT